MKANELIANLNPSDAVLVAQYESLTQNQRKFADQLMEEYYYNVRDAIEAASKVQKWDRFGNPRSKKIEYLRKHEEGTGFYSFYRMIKKYDSLTEEQQILCYGLVEDNKYDFDEALEKAQKDYVFVCRTHLPRGCELHLWSKDGEHWNTEALKDIGEAMLDKNIYPTTFLNGYYRYKKEGHYINKKNYLELMRLQSGWYLDTEQIARGAIEECTIDYYTDPDAEYNYHYVFLDKVSFWHNMPSWEWEGDERELYKKKNLTYEDMQKREMQRWLDAMAVVGD